jgi:hypothetical protein
MTIAGRLSAPAERPRAARVVAFGPVDVPRAERRLEGEGITRGEDISAKKKPTIDSLTLLLKKQKKRGLDTLSMKFARNLKLEHKFVHSRFR